MRERGREGVTEREAGREGERGRGREGERGRGREGGERKQELVCTEQRKEGEGGGGVLGRDNE